MDQDFIISLEKFMDRMGITYDVEISRDYYSRDGRQVCIRVLAHYQGEEQYYQHHCYGLRNGKVFYSEGNEVMGINDGVLAYLGKEKEIDNYFEDKTRAIARNYLRGE
jgi:hypothetical protein